MTPREKSLCLICRIAMRNGCTLTQMLGPRRLKPDDDNQADAIGILAHTLKMEKIDAPWAVATFDKTALGAAA